MDRSLTVPRSHGLILAALGGALCALLPCTNAVQAAAPSPATPAARQSAAPAPEAAFGAAAYAKALVDAEKQPGLFTIYRKEGRVAMELTADQFGKDYLEHVVPANGLGGFGFHAGQMFAQEARIVRFQHDGTRVVMIWPHTRFQATPGTPLATAVRESTADSVQ